ncbi:MAG TPA: asparagine synthase (glutamine-hydrolyzing) [Bacteroidia bacterium]|jgi:asparagine synthase (glutamine-hydrolysing)|nr:asparagine synthase (glutamine-hydrolyzing) [Bacteroidia bacterium]
MCGIAGYIASQKLNGAAMLSSLHHRGPDHEGFFEASFPAKEIYLGHTRLSILDLSENGNQPMFSDNKEIAIVFNGEVYNFQDLRKTHLRSEKFVSSTDTEVILKLYEKLGISFVKELQGDFAISILDKKAGKLFLIRDRIGVKPLYYCAHNNQLIFASEIKGILAAGIKAELNEEELLDYFVFKYSSKNKTLYKNIFRLAPAHVLEYDLEKNNFIIQPYWDLHKNNKYTGLSYSQAKECLFELVKESINQRLISDVAIGNFLSGGLDSSIIAFFLKERKDIIHYCARKAEKDLKKEGTTSDYHYAAQLAKDWNLKLVAADIGKEEATLEMIRKTLSYSDDLIADGSQIPSYLITHEAAKTSKVILSGMGADELFLGYAGHMLTLVSSQWLGKAPFSKTIGNMAAKVNQGKGKFLAYRRYIHKMGKYNSLPDYKYALFNIVGDFDNSCSVYKGNKERIIDELSAYFPKGQNTFDSLAHFEMENFLVKNLHYTDRMAMANSVECRVPFLDHRIVEFAYSIPLNYKLNNSGKFKRILKDTFKSHVPDYVLKRRKAGFGMPLRSIFSSEENINGLLNKSFFTNFHSFSVENIERIIENHVSGKEDNSSIIYALISFQEWYKLNFT